MYLTDFNEMETNTAKFEQLPPFIGSYAPVAQAGQMGPFFVNTYLLQPTRRMEVVGPVAVRSRDLECRK